MAVAAIIIVAAVAAVAAGASAYMASENAQAQAKAQRNMADWQEKVEEQQAEAARKQVRLKAQRMLNAQASKAGGAGVVAGEGSLLTDQLEAASLSQYEEDLAGYSHELGAQTHRFESKLFRNQLNRIKSQEWIGVGLAAGGSAASSYSSYLNRTGGSGNGSGTGSTGTTVATSGAGGGGFGGGGGY